MHKRERLENTFAGEPTDRPPVALWRHWQGDDQRTADLAHAIVNFQKSYDWDFINVTPASTSAVIDYGGQTAWQHDLYGDRVMTRYPVEKSLQWTELRPNDPQRGELGKYLETLRLIGNEAQNTPIIATVYSPLAQAARLSGQDLLLRNMRIHPDRLHTGLNVITESLLRFVDALKHTEIAGIYYVIEHADYAVMSLDEYKNFGASYDRKILEALTSRWWFNMIGLPGSAPMFQVLSQYPVHAINWNSNDARPDLERARTLFTGALCTGLSQETHIDTGTPTTIKAAAQTAIEKMGSRKLILSAGGVIPVTTPISNLRATRNSVDSLTIGLL